MDHKEKNLLVIGGTGATGSKVVDKLRSKFSKVYVLSRREQPPIEGVKFVAGNIKDPNCFDPIEADIHKIVVCLGTRSYYGENGTKEMELRGIENLVRYFKMKGTVEHVILLSAFGIGRKSWVLNIFSKVFNDYFTVKSRIEELILNWNVPYTFVRPVELLSGINTGRPILNQKANLSLIRFVSRECLAEVLSEAALHSSSKNKIFELSGSTKKEPIQNWNQEFSLLNECKSLELGKTLLL